jgi:hypothetical protein
MSYHQELFKTAFAYRDLPMMKTLYGKISKDVILGEDSIFYKAAKDVAVVSTSDDKTSGPKLLLSSLLTWFNIDWYDMITPSACDSSSQVLGSSIFQQLCLEGNQPAVKIIVNKLRVSRNQIIDFGFILACHAENELLFSWFIRRYKITWMHLMKRNDVSTPWLFISCCALNYPAKIDINCAPSGGRMSSIEKNQRHNVLLNMLVPKNAKNEDIKSTAFTMLHAGEIELYSWFARHVAIPEESIKMLHPEHQDAPSRAS